LAFYKKENTRFKNGLQLAAKKPNDRSIRNKVEPKKARSTTKKQKDFKKKKF